MWCGQPERSESLTWRYWNLASTQSKASRVVSLDESEVLTSEAFGAELGELAASLGQSESEARAYAQRCLAELAVHPEDRYLRRVVKLARFMTSRSYDPVLDLRDDELETLKRLSRKHPLVFLWSHKSHLDSFVFLRALYESDFRPQPLSFAGINMNFMGFGQLAKRSGAVFLRRTFKDDEIYKLVFKHYIDFLVASGLHLSWSIEGTRSRTGKLMPPKLGLLQWVVESLHRAGREDALLIPVSIAFDQIAEIDDYVSMQHGKTKRKESLRWFIEYIRGMATPFGKIYVRFAPPVELGQAVSIPDAMFAPGQPASRTQVQKLAFEVSGRIEQATPIKLADLVTLILLCANGRALEDAEIAAHGHQILDLVEAAGFPTAGALTSAFGEQLPEAMTALTRTGLLASHAVGDQIIYRIPEKKQLAAAYYRNTIVHYFLSPAIAELALACTMENAKPTPKILWEFVMQLRDLLKFEFFFKPKAQFKLDVSDYLSMRYPRWQMALQVGKERDALLVGTPPLFGHGILRSFVESFVVLGKVLQQTDFGEVKTLEQRCLEQGKQMLWRHEISSAAALSKPLFSNALRLAKHRGLVSGSAQLRDEFGASMAAFHSGLNTLQQAYDAAAKAASE